MRSESLTRVSPFSLPGKWPPSVNCFRHPWGAHPLHSFPSYPMSQCPSKMHQQVFSRCPLETHSLSG